MPALPPEEVTMDEIIAWDAVKQLLAKLKSQESLLRGRIARIIFPSPVEGSRNDHPLLQGWILKLTHVINRKVDEAAWKASGHTLREHGIPDDIIVYKPELSKSAYNGLTAEQKHMVDNFLIVTDGSPQLEIKLPARAAKAQGAN